MNTTTRILAMAVAAHLLAASARAEVSPWYIGVVGALEYDTNIYRAADGEVIPAGLSKADTVLTASLIGGFDQHIGRQHVYGSMSLDNSRYRSNSQLDNHGYALSLGLDWAVAERLSGTLTARADQNLVSFRNRTGPAIQTTKNIQNVNQVDAHFALGTVTRLTLVADLGWRERLYSEPSYSRAEYDENKWSAGAKYRSSGALTLGAAYRSTMTTYPNFIVGNLVLGDVASHVARKDLDLSAEWIPSGASELFVRISPTHLAYENISAQDRSEITGAASWLWHPRDQLKLKALFSRDTGQSSQANPQGSSVVDYSRMTTAMRLIGDYEVTAKTTLNATIAGELRDLTNLRALPLPPTIEEGKDRTLLLSLGAVWNPTRSAQLGCSLSRERRTTDSPQISFPYTAGIFRCYGQLVLQ